MYQKNSIRQQIRIAIKNLTVAERNMASKQMTARALSYLTKKSLGNIKNIACYWPTKYEINTIELIDALIIQNKNCYLPIINENTNNLDFIKYTHTTKLIKNKFGILEPQFDINKLIKIMELDIILMPLVAFDSLGNRIGSGAGLYDHSLIFNGNRVPCQLIGLAYSIQQVANFVINEWDVNLDAVITEQQSLYFS